MPDEINVDLIKKLIEDITLLRNNKQDIKNLTIGKARVLQKVAKTLYKSL